MIAWVTAGVLRLLRAGDVVLDALRVVAVTAWLLSSVLFLVMVISWALGWLVVLMWVVLPSLLLIWIEVSERRRRSAHEEP